MFDKTYLLTGGLTMSMLGLMFSLIQVFDFAGPCFAAGGTLMWLWVACEDKDRGDPFSPELMKQIKETLEQGERLRRMALKNLAKFEDAENITRKARGDES